MGVQSDAINTLAEVHNRQVKKGLKTYGKPVVPFNGRSAYNDAMEEIVDTAVYVTQLEQERAILKLALESLYGACMRFLDSPLSSVMNSHVRIEFSEEVRSVREDLSAIGFVMNDDTDERYYADSIAAFHAHIKAMLDDEDEYGGTMPESAFVHVDMADAIGAVEESIYDAEDIGEGGVDPNPACPKCGDELEWDSGDDSVGWPGQWYCALCDREGVVEDES